VTGPVANVPTTTSTPNIVGTVLNETTAQAEARIANGAIPINFTSGQSLSDDEALEAGKIWVGPNYKEAIGQNPGTPTGVFRSQPDANGYVRQFRIDTNSLQGSHYPNVPHVHFEVYDSSGALVANNHVPLR
jgi:hypothetical protein